MSFDEFKNKFRMDINRSLLAIAFTLFGLMVSLKPAILSNIPLIAIQLTIAVPLLLSSTFGRSRLHTAKNKRIWEEYCFVTFLLGYSLLINVLGILLTLVIGLQFGILFFAVNILVSIIYSSVEIFEDRSRLLQRTLKDLSFFFLILIGGILPSMGIY